MFSCEFCKISKNIFFTEHLWATASKMKPIDVKPRTYIDSSKEINDDKDRESKIGDIVRISQYKTIFAKSYVPNWPEEVFVVTKSKNTVMNLCY